MEDYRVKGKSNEDLEKIAQLWRRAFQDAGLSHLNVYDALCRVGAIFEDVKGLELIVKSDAEMGEREAYATSPPPRIFVKKAVPELVRRNDPRAQFTLLHEFAHILLHPGDQPKARIARGNITPGYIQPANSAEHQANYFAAAFQMPRNELFGLQSADEIQQKFGVSRRAAEIRFAQVIEPTVRRELPESVVRLKRELAQASSVSGDNPLPASAEAAWHKLDSASEHDPSQYRIARGYLIARTEFNRMTPFGWFIQNGQVVPFFMTDINMYS